MVASNVCPWNGADDGLLYSAVEMLWDHDVIDLIVVDSIRCMLCPFMGVLVVSQCVCQYTVVIGGNLM